ncbi:hypothetical protein VKT23_017937 [Stygiomarasmius scandens]|uniref:Uncharacterized protein n=1 Tax=Marasmiellus scandens TaxID=2682957 RepID=A0ABR1IQL4_9AGAR
MHVIFPVHAVDDPFRVHFTGSSFPIPGSKLIHSLGNFLHRRLCPAVFNGDLWYPGFIYSRFACGGDPALANVQSPSRQMVTGCGEQEIKVE